MNTEPKSVAKTGITESALVGTGIAVLSLVAVIFAPVLAGPALLVGMLAGGIALRDPNTPLWVKAVIWGCFAGLYFVGLPTLLTWFFGDDLGDLSGLLFISKITGGLAAVAAVVHIGLAIKEAAKSHPEAAR